MWKMAIPQFSGQICLSKKDYTYLLILRKTSQVYNELLNILFTA